MNKTPNAGGGRGALSRDLPHGYILALVVPDAGVGSRAGLHPQLALVGLCHPPTHRWPVWPSQL